MRACLHTFTHIYTLLHTFTHVYTPVKRPEGGRSRTVSVETLSLGYACQQANQEHSRNVTTCFSFVSLSVHRFKPPNAFCRSSYFRRQSSYFFGAFLPATDKRRKEVSEQRQGCVRESVQARRHVCRTHCGCARTRQEITK